MIPPTQDPFQKPGWGLFIHYLPDGASASKPIDLDVEAWNQRVDALNVDRLADQAAEAGAGYVFLTIGQNSGYYLSPNSAFDSIVGRRPSRLSRRDLVADLALALAKRGVALGAYLPSGAPELDAVAVEKLQWKRGEFRNAEFQVMWESVIREWSLRWKDRVFAWWIDGVYFAKTMYEHPETPNYGSFAAALRAGNPKAHVAFNPGCRTQIASMCPEESYSAGELDYFFAVSGRRPIDSKGFNLPERIAGKQVHFLGFLGDWWGQGMPRFPVDLVCGYTQHIREHGGAVSWDVPVTLSGEIPPAFMAQLCQIGRRLPTTT